MRIISGSLRSRLIKAPKGEGFRPTTDRVRESVFNLLGNRSSNAKVLDLYAGSGSLGIEALSRGAAAALFIDNNRTSVEAIMKNLEDLDLISKAKVVKGEVLSELKRMAGFGNIFDLIFLDPPYSINIAELQEVLITSARCIDQSGLIVFESGTDLNESLVSSLGEIYRKKYGATLVYFYKKRTDVNRT